MTRFNEFIVGLVFISAMMILGYFTILRGELLERREYFSSTIIFDDVEGLISGDKVLVNGVNMGTVEKIDLMEDSRVLVTVSLRRELMLYENYKITLKNQSALGGKVIAINPGRAEFEGEYFSRVTGTENLKGYTIGDPLSKLSELIDENRENIAVTLQNVREFTDKLNSGKGTLGKLVNEDTIHADTGKLINELRDAVEDSREQAPVTSFIRAALTAF
jgi:phospholipid/cholesterol/gamma-HCH transport system substrate-binding protein